MTEKQLSLLNKYLSAESINKLEEKGPQAVSNFINMAIQLRQPNRWSHWVAKHLDTTDPISYETLLEKGILDLFSFIQFVAE